MLQLTANICSVPIKCSVNTAIKSAKFPKELKLANITVIFKKGDKTEPQNYRPISILPTVSKIFEKVLEKQLSEFFKPLFSNLLCGFRNGYSTQHALAQY